mgnify:CR=1 FL=1
MLFEIMFFLGVFLMVIASIIESEVELIVSNVKGAKIKIAHTMKKRYENLEIYYDYLSANDLSRIKYYYLYNLNI